MTALAVIITAAIILMFAEVLLVNHAINKWTRVQNVRTQQFNQLFTVIAQLRESLNARDRS